MTQHEIIKAINALAKVIKANSKTTDTGGVIKEANEKIKQLITYLNYGRGYKQ